MATSSIHVALPQSTLFQFPPSSEPATLSPPTSDFTLARPFNVPEDWYSYLLRAEFPVAIALLYAVSATIGNRANRQRGWKPWSLSKNSLFFCFVVLHNVALAAYSAWTFVGMANAIKNSWPGWENENGLVGVVDSLCKINGPRGLGSAATYNVETQSWAIADRTMKLLDGLPDSTDVGRIWNEGLAFYGWLFYVSKFYEVVDTMILFTKGKKTSFLQVFHHTGAMICVWAGIRYMSPPIWMFVFINSGIHVLMYTYYTLSAFSIQTPPVVKQTLTTLQIAQIIFGASYAVAHLFLSYDAPVNVPYLFTHSLSTALSTLPTSASSAIASATASAGLGNLLKKVALRAAGEEGLAENVRNKFGEPFGIDAVKAIEVEKAQEEIRYRMESARVNCIDTSGEAFAIWLNILYLAPLTLLFFRFFANAYNARSSQQSTSAKVQQSTRSAVRDVKAEIKDSTALKNDNEDMDPPADVKAKLAAAKERVKTAEAILGEKASAISSKVGELYEQGKERLQEAGRSKPDGNADPSIDNPDNGAGPKADISSLEKDEGVSKEANDDESKGTVGEDSKKENGDAPNGDGKEESRKSEEDTPKKEIGDAQAYEASIDEVKNEEEDKAEEEMQPEGV